MVYLKVSLYVDEKLWVRFKEAVLRRHGTLRKLSSEVESLLRFSLVEQNIQSAFEKMGVEVESMISSDEVKQNRPKLRGPPSEELIRQMRGKYIAEALPRQQRHS